LSPLKFACVPSFIACDSKLKGASKRHAVYTKFRKYVTVEYVYVCDNRRHLDASLQ